MVWKWSSNNTRSSVFRNYEKLELKFDGGTNLFLRG